MYVRGVGPQRAQQLETKGLKTVGDLLAYPPHRYEDRSNVKPIAKLAPGEMATVIVKVRTANSGGFRRGKLNVFTAVLEDGSGSYLTAKWFNGQYLEKVMQPGASVALFGKVEFDRGLMGPTMLHPDHELLPAEDAEASLHTGRIVPVHEAIGKLSKRVLRQIVWNITQQLAPLMDPLPKPVLQKLKLKDLRESLIECHFAPANTDLRVLNAFRTPGQFRLIFEEFFWLECGLALKRRKAKAEKGIAFALTDRVRDQIREMLPFKPTNAQKRVLAEIAKDMSDQKPMHRLLQGDVGSGKTLVAAEASIIAIENGYQVALLAPTEILATQHYFTFKKLLEKVGYVVVLLRGSQTAREKAQIKRMLASGMVHCVVGTHALLEESVEFDSLGLAIIDEQHRFGVMQRLKLSKKGETPDTLVMTATPIPRTLALTIYGDLDVSVIDEFPPGRKPIRTKHFFVDQQELAYSEMLGQIQAGRQAYVVCPVIETNEALDVKAAEETFHELSHHVFPQLRVALLHGKLSADNKEAIMSGFQRGEIQVLVSTTVIEVGVDVPNATVMAILSAERFGLAQLHQLRGRVGRGEHQSTCYLITGKLSEGGQERIAAMVASNDGFYLSEMDLKLRGPGEFFGTKQSGLPALRFANLIRDQEVLELARSEAMNFIDHPPSEAELKTAVQFIRQHWQRRYGLVQVG
jgi:ATP-dependent DNA helicase RecG